MPRSTNGRASGRSGLRLIAMAALLALSAGRAEAQWGFGFGGFNYQPPEVGFLNSRSLALTAKAHGPTQNNAYANNPNAYVNHLHDEGYLDRYDVATRRSIESSVGRYGESFSARPTPAPAQPVAPPQPPASPDLALSSFFDRYAKLAWPGVAPSLGELGQKKEVSDLSSAAVLNEYNLKGLATLSNVTEARTKLLDYGKPALQYVRENSTPRLADSFHLFLLSLYESIGQAATRPKTPEPAAKPN